MDKAVEDSTIVSIVYTNYRGETAERKIQPIKIWFGATEWHKKSQWLLEATDIDKGEKRDFAMSDIASWNS